MKGIYRLKFKKREQSNEIETKNRAYFKQTGSKYICALFNRIYKEKSIKNMPKQEVTMSYHSNNEKQVLT